MSTDTIAHKGRTTSVPTAEHAALTTGVPDVLSDAEAHAFLRLRPGTLPRWRMERRGPAWSNAGRRVLYLKADLLAFLAANRVEPMPARTSEGSGAVSVVARTASQGIPGIPAPGDLSAGFSDGFGVVA